MDCLVTKLKGIVENDALYKLGETRLPVVNGSGMTLLNRNDTQVINGLGGVLIDGTATKRLSVGWNNNIVISGLSEDAVGYIQVLNKYDINAILGRNCLNISGSEELEKTFAGMSLIQIGFNKVVCSFADFPKFGALATLDMNYPELSGSISDLYPLKDTLTTFTVQHVAKGTYTGSFDDLGHLYKINDLKFTPLYLNLSGTVEGYVANRLIEQPATAGSVAVNWLGSLGKITYQGQPITDKANNTIAWDASGNITLS